MSDQFFDIELNVDQTLLITKQNLFTNPNNPTISFHNLTSSPYFLITSLPFTPPKMPNTTTTSQSQSSKIARSHSTISMEQKVYMDQLYAQKSSLQSEINQKYKNMLRQTHQMEETGASINTNLKGQTDKLHNIHSLTNDTHKLLKKANQTSKEMSSFWYSIGKKIKRVFVKDDDDDTQLEGNYDGKGSKKHTSIDTQDYQPTAQFSKCQTPSSQDKETQNTTEQDQYLDELTNQIRKLKGIGKLTNKQLDKQTDLIQTITHKTDQNSSKMEECNKRIKKNFF